MNKKTIWASVVAGAAITVLSACLLPVGDGEGLNTDGDLGASIVCPDEAVPTFADTSSSPVSFATQIQPIFTQKCTGCHGNNTGVGWTGTGGANNGLNLTAGNSHALLVNIPTYEKPEESPFLRVVPGNPDCSYLVQKISTTTPKDGSRMPPAPALSQPEIDLIRAWIRNGASQ